MSKLPGTMYAAQRKANELGFSFVTVKPVHVVSDERFDAAFDHYMGMSFPIIGPWFFVDDELDNFSLLTTNGTIVTYSRENAS